MQYKYVDDCYSRKIVNSKSIKIICHCEHEIKDTNAFDTLASNMI